MIKHSIHSQRGASLTEYALLVSLVAVVAIASVSYMGSSVYCEFNDTAISVDQLVPRDQIRPEDCDMRNGGLPPMFREGEGGGGEEGGG